MSVFELAIRKDLLTPSFIILYVSSPITTTSVPVLTIDVFNPLDRGCNPSKAFKSKISRIGSSKFEQMLPLSLSSVDPSV